MDSDTQTLSFIVNIGHPLNKYPWRDTFAPADIRLPENYEWDKTAYNENKETWLHANNGTYDKKNPPTLKVLHRDKFGTWSHATLLLRTVYSKLDTYGNHPMYDSIYVSTDAVLAFRKLIETVVANAFKLRDKRFYRSHFNGCPENIDNKKVFYRHLFAKEMPYNGANIHSQVYGLVRYLIFGWRAYSTKNKEELVEELAPYTSILKKINRELINFVACVDECGQEPNFIYKANVHQRLFDGIWKQGKMEDFIDEISLNYYDPNQPTRLVESHCYAIKMLNEHTNRTHNLEELVYNEYEERALPVVVLREEIVLADKDSKANVMTTCRHFFYYLTTRPHPLALYNPKHEKLILQALADGKLAIPEKFDKIVGIDIYSDEPNECDENW